MADPEGDTFLKRIQDLSTIEFSCIQNKDISLITGPPNSGKSTILNMIAGSKLTGKKNECDQWEINADPIVATIGHKVSETFVPNYWDDSLGNRYFDCAGFDETRGLDYEIAKSCILKTIGNHARSLKVIIVVDFYTLNSERGSTFNKMIDQIKNFIPEMNFEAEAELIITKSPHNKTTLHISKILQNTNLGKSYPESKITILYEPDEKTGILTCLDLSKVIDRAPSLTKKCQIPLSNEAKLKIGKLKEEFNQDIKNSINKFCSRVDFYYLNLLQNTLEIDDKTLRNWYDSFKENVNAFTQSKSVEHFLENFNKLIEKLNSLVKNDKCLKCDDILRTLIKNTGNLSFLEQLSNEVNNLNLVSWWVSDFTFTHPLLSKNNNLAKCKSLDDFNSFLIRKNIDPKKCIKDQIHQILKTPYNFSASYSGSKFHSGSKSYSGAMDFFGSTLYSGSIQYNFLIPYSGTVYYSGHKDVSESVSVSNCTHTFALFGNACLLCGRYTMEKPYTKSVFYDGYVPFSGQERVSGRQPYSGSIYYSDTKNYSGTVNYDLNVPFSGSQSVTCQDHHICSCQDLSVIVFSAQELFEDIQYYKNIIKLQKKWLNEDQIITEPEIDIKTIMSNFSIKGKNLELEKKNENELTKKIHEILSVSQNFDSKYSGSVKFSVRKPYTGNVSYEDFKTVESTVIIHKKIDYSGEVYYSGNQDYSGSVKVSSCNEGCIMCISKSDMDEFYSGNIDYEGKQNYSGTQHAKRSEKYSHKVYFKQDKEYAGQVECCGSIPYSGSHNVVCQKKEIGEGHHNCDPCCNIWESFVSNLTALFNEKEKYINIINKQKILLEKKMK